jgi:hypothetical protein
MSVMKTQYSHSKQMLEAMKRVKEAYQDPKKSFSSPGAVGNKQTYPKGMEWK